MIVVMKDAGPDQLSEARSILLVHQPAAGMGGLCGGCYEFACRFALWPCPQVRWAQDVVATENGGERK